MTLESEFREVQQSRNAHETWLQFLAATPNEQELTLKLLSVRVQDLQHQVDSLAALALEAQKRAQIATAKSMGMPAEMIDKYISEVFND